jgi:hypothetical protein
MSDNDGRMLGLRPADRNRPVLKLQSMLSGELPTVPLIVDHYSAVSDFGLYANNLFGEGTPYPPSATPARRPAATSPSSPGPS